MTTPYRSQLIRLKCDMTKHEASNDILTSSAPAAWRSVDLRIDIAAYLNAALADVSLWGGLTLRIVPKDQFSATPLITKPYAGAFSAITEDNWANGTAQHATFIIPFSEMDFLTGWPSGANTNTYSLIIDGTTNETPQKRFVVCRTTLQIDDAGVGTL